MTTEDRPALHEVWGKLVAKAWDNPDFEKRMLADPRQALAEKGFDLPEEVTVRVCGTEPVEPADGVLFLPYPPSPNRELADNELAAVAGGTQGLLQGMDSSGLGELSALQLQLGHRIESLNPDFARLMTPLNLPPRP